MTDTFALAPQRSGAGKPLCEDPTVLQGYVLNVAETLCNQFIPVLDASNRTRAFDCITVLLRVVDSLSRDARIGRESDEQSILEDELARLRKSEAKVASARESFRHASAGERRFENDKLEAYLRRHSCGGHTTRVTESRLLMNGRSKLTALVGQEGAAMLPDYFVLRQDWGGGGVQGTTVVTEFSLLRALADAGLKVPKPLLLEPSADVLGAPFMLVTRMGGTAQGTYFDPPPLSSVATQMAEQLARLHSLPLLLVEESGLRREATTAAGRLEGVNEFRRIHEQWGPREPLVEIALEWLEANCQQIDGALALIHNDLGSHNLLVDGDSLVAILDWELAAIGNPAADLGYARHWLTRLMPWEEFMSAYHGAGGPRIDRLTLDFYSVWSRIRLYSMLLQARAGIAARVIHDMEITGICADSVPRLLANLGDDLKSILGR